MSAAFFHFQPNVDRLREIAREMRAPITEAQGYFWMSLPERAASGGWRDDEGHTEEPALWPHAR